VQRCLRRAEAIARSRKHDEVDVKHLLLASLDEYPELFTDADLDAPAIRKALDAALPPAGVHARRRSELRLSGAALDALAGAGAHARFDGAQTLEPPFLLVGLTHTVGEVLALDFVEIRRRLGLDDMEWPVWERPPLRDILTGAWRNSRRARAATIDTEHVLLALLDEDESVDGLLDRFGVEAAAVRRCVESRVPDAGGAAFGRLPFTARVKAVLEDAFEETRRCGRDAVHADVLLLALARRPGLAQTILCDECGLDAERLAASLR
jgi:ATP-dependent Clp protease ATP-binding subunit ClpA